MKTRYEPTWRRTPEPLEGEDSWKLAHVCEEAKTNLRVPLWLKWILVSLAILWAGDVAANIIEGLTKWGMNQ